MVDLLNSKIALVDGKNHSMLQKQSVPVNVHEPRFKAPQRKVTKWDQSAL